MYLRTFWIIALLISLMLAGCSSNSDSNRLPVADAGLNQNITTGTMVTLDGSNSTDADGDLLSYVWSLVSRPDGSSATLSSSTVVNPTFTADIDGEYVLQLIVNDGKLASLPDTVTIVATTVTPKSLIITGVWSQPQLLETLTTAVVAERPAVAIGADGSATVTWLQNSSTIGSNFFSRGSGSWEQEAILIEGSNLSDPTVAMDASSNSVLAWQSQLESPAILRYNFRSEDGNLSGPSRLDEYDYSWWGPIGAAFPPKLAMNNAGQGFAIWNQITPSSYGWYQNLWIRLFNTTTAQWTGPFNLNYSNLGGPAGDYYSNSFDPQIAMNAAGSAVVVWKRTTGYYGFGSPYYELPALKAMVFDNSSDTPAWKALARLDNESILPAKAKTVIDAQGNVVVVWLQEVGMVNNLYYSRLAAGADTWSAAATLENSDTQIRDFDMTVDGAGNVLVVWDQEVDSTPRFFFSRFEIGSSSWSTPLSEMNASGRLAVGMDEDGNAMAVWRMPKIGGGDGVYASRYNPAATNVFWSSPERLDTLPGTTGDPVLAVNAAGNTFVSWIQNDGTTDSVFASYLK